MEPYIELYHKVQVHYKRGIPAIMFLVQVLKTVRIMNWFVVVLKSVGYE